MKKHPSLFAVITLCFIFAVGFALLNQLNIKADGPGITPVVSPTPTSTLLKTEMAKSDAIKKKFMKTPQTLPFTYTLNDKLIRGIPTSWKPKTTVKNVNSTVVKTMIIGIEPKTKLKLTFELTSYKDFPVNEWIVWFEASGKSTTQVISDIQAINYSFQGSNPSLTSCNGDFYNANGYTITNTKLTGQSLYFEPVGGRPSDSAFPYYRMLFKDYGIAMAIGWPCQWYASFNGTSKGTTVSSGQASITTKLYSGEKIRSPRMTLLTFTNGEANGINLWRSWYRKYILVKPDGKQISPLYASSSTGDSTIYPGVTEENRIKYTIEMKESTGNSEINQLSFIDKFNNLGYNFNVWWMDAGWYDCYDKELKVDYWWETGNWKPDPIRFPNGLKSISDKLHANGQKLLLWFEPERVYKGTAIAVEHPKWLLKDSNASATQFIINLGNKDCRLWLTNMIDKSIKNYGVDIYRQDFNIAPLGRMQGMDTTNRTGITENLYVQGYLQFFDDLLARNPGLIIDSCASGGRRNDLETMRRAVPLHVSDYGYGITVTKQAFQNTLYQWFPYFGGFPASSEFDAANSLRDSNHQLDPLNDVDKFASYVGLAPLFSGNVNVSNDKFDFASSLELKKLWEQINRFLIGGDYYLLGKNTRKSAIWNVRQFDMPSSGEGIIELFRNIDSKVASFIIHPKGSIKSNCKYELSNLTDGSKTQITGQEWLNSGYKVSLGKREACIIKYSIIK